MTTAKVLIALGLAALFVRAQVSETSTASSRVIIVKGTIKSKKVWGPPNFGETPKQDARYVIYVLKLKEGKTATELSLNEESENSHRRYTELQLRCDIGLFPKCERLISHSVGREVTIGGRAEYRVAPTDYLPVTMDVFLIQKE
jgi:hypothetical protein